MMFADLIDQVDFIEALQGLGQSVTADSDLSEVVAQLDLHNPEVLGYLTSLLDPELNVHPEVLNQVSSVINNLS